MIKATIQNSPYCTESVFSFSETELSMLIDCEASLDALNYLSKHMDGMSNLYAYLCHFLIFT